MPVKRTLQKGRIDPMVECEMFDTVFKCGQDFFNELSIIGLEEPISEKRYGSSQNELHAEYFPKFIETARDAWNRIGQIWIDEFWSKERYPDPLHKIWAYIMFGPPQETKHD